MFPVPVFSLLTSEGIFWNAPPTQRFRFHFGPTKPGEILKYSDIIHKATYKWKANYYGVLPGVPKGSYLFCLFLSVPEGCELPSTTNSTVQDSDGLETVGLNTAYATMELVCKMLPF
jgi:hypothetical protein